jgi:predicted lipoprotein with Yx(FWY)xxD motif
MKINSLIVTALVALTLLVSACAPAATPTTQPPTAMPAATQAPAATAMSGGSSATAMPADTATASSAMSGAAATVNVGKNAKYSAFLVDGKGMTLYLFTKDSPGASTSACSGNCAKSWPPLLTTGKPVAGTGVDMSKFGTITLADGTTQVTYNGWPLYYYAKDQQPGDTNGDGVGSVWYLITPNGDKAVSSGY